MTFETNLKEREDKSRDEGEGYSMTKGMNAGSEILKWEKTTPSYVAGI